MAPFLLVVVAAGFLGSYTIVRAVTTSFGERFENQLAETSRVAADGLVRQEQRHLETLRSVVFTEGFTEAVRRGDLASVEAIVLPVAANDGIELIEVLDAGGRSVAGYPVISGRLQPVAVADHSSWSIVRSVLAGVADDRGDRHVAIGSGPLGPSLYTSAPVTYAGEIVGAVLVGSSLATFLPEIKATTLADVTYFTAAGDPIATTFTEPLDGDWSTLQLPTPRAGDRATVALAGRDYELLVSPMVLRGSAVGFTAVALPKDFVTFAQAATARRLALLMGGGAVAMLATGWAVSRSLTRPLARLVNATQAVRAGDLSARSSVRRSDEIGDLAVSFDHMAEALQRTHLGTLEALVSAIDARDAYTRGHSVRVGHLAEAIGHRLGLPSEDRQHLLVGGYLHDIGKIGVRDAVLLKPGNLSPEERSAIEGHPEIGLAILGPVGLPEETLAAIGQHHERLDGSGYPGGLAGAEVSIYARIVTIADVYDALITDRPYRAALPTEEVFAILDEEVNRGRIDGEVVAALREIEPQWAMRRAADPSLDGFRLEADRIRPLRRGQLMEVA
ncbi:MAG: HD domain-containing phosphohydrolase [Dehalococcoidia bacterium]